MWAARPFFALYKATDKLTYHINFDTGHNYGQDNPEAFYRVLRDTFYPADKSFPVTEIRSEAEVRTAEQLQVPLPADNLDFHTIALQLSRGLPRKTDRTLARIVRAKTYAIAAEEAGAAEVDITVKHWRFRTMIGPYPRCPALAVRPPLFSLATRGALRWRHKQLSEGGASSRSIRFTLIHRLRRLDLGLVLSRRWPWRLSPALSQRSKTHDALSSLRDVIDKNMTVDQAPELFSFGLLESSTTLSNPSRVYTGRGASRRGK